MVAKSRPIVVIDTSVFIRGDLIGADQNRFIVSENRKHLAPGTNYASFLFVTSHGLLERISR